MPRMSPNISLGSRLLSATRRNRVSPAKSIQAAVRPFHAALGAIHMSAFYSGVSALAVAVLLGGCSSGGNCVSLRDDDPLKDVDRLSEFARTVNVVVTDRDAAFIVGGAMAFRQVERSDVRACIRTRSDGGVEYRLVANNGAVAEWRSPPPPLPTAR